MDNMNSISLDAETQPRAKVTVKSPNGTYITYELIVKDNGLQIDTVSNLGRKNHTSTKLSYWEHPDLRK
jgi:hypothetical protein